MMNTTVYVNNLSAAADLSEIESLFSLVGDVESQHLDSDTLTSRGASIGVFKMANEQQAADCIERYHGTKALGQLLSLTLLRPVIPAPVAAEPVKRKKRG